MLQTALNAPARQIAAVLLCATHTRLHTRVELLQIYTHNAYNKRPAAITAELVEMARTGAESKPIHTVNGL
jgi:hypothetical protein